MRWGQDRERHLLQHGPEQKNKEVPTFKEFAPKFLESYAKADRHKPSGIASKESILRIHLIPFFGAQRLDAITNAKVQQLKLHLQEKSPKTVNNVLAVLSVLLKAALEWELIEQLPCSIRLLPVPRRDAAFHDFDAYQKLLDAARSIDWRTYLIALLGGEGGLRVGEIVALEWSDIDLERRQIGVRDSDWRGRFQSARPKCRAANARPDPDFRYFSKRTASFSVGNDRDTTTDHGRFDKVWPQGPWLCPFESRGQITGDPHVVPGWIDIASEDVDDSPWRAMHVP